MADLSLLSRRAQLGLETTEGTPVAATKRLPNLKFSLSPQMNFKTYMGNGSKFINSVVAGTEWTEGDYEGPVSFGEIVYPLASLANYAAPDTADGATTWVFTPNVNGPDVSRAYTLEVGNTLQADQVRGLFFNGLTLTFSPDDADMNGSFIGRELAVLPSITTAGVTNVENKVAHATRTELYYASTFAALDTSPTLVTRAFAAEFNLDGKYGTFTAMNASNPSFTGRAEQAPDATLTLTLGAEYSGTDFVEPITLADARAGNTHYLRLRTTTTEVIGTSALTYSLTLDMAAKVTAAYSLGEQDDVLKNVEWELSLTEDEVSGKAFEITVINATPSL